MSALLRLAFALAVAAGLASCQTADDAGSGPPKAEPAYVARLAFAGGSAASGSVRFHPVAGGVFVMVDLLTGTSGRWRAVIHATGICTSPNAFSAGPPLLPSGFSAPIVVAVTTNVDGAGEATMRIAGLAIDGPAGIRGKSVVIHAGATGTLDAQPDVPNDRVACGVIETARPLF